MQAINEGPSSKKVDHCDSITKYADFIIILIFFQDIDGEYQVELTFTMDAELAGKPFSLEIENELGKTTYEFDLALDDQPPSGK